MKQDVLQVKNDKGRLPSTMVVIAALNEQEGIGLTIAEMMDSLGFPRVLVVDGKSTDRTVQVSKNMGAEIVFQDGKGKGDAVAKALDYLDLSVDYVVLTDADFTYPGGNVPAMIQILEKNPSVGMVCGSRLNDYVDPKALNTVFNIGNKLIGFAHNLLNGIPLKDPLTGLRVVRAEILRNWKVKSKGFDIEVELNHHVERKGFSIVEVPIQYRERLGVKKLKPKHGVAILKRILLETTY
jgi:glycosyltransferase involved in cell wall biosynthesis